MKDLKWNNSLSVGIDEIDDDHRKLVDLFNILVHALAEEASSDYIEAVLKELINCTAWHFSHEERLMIKYDYEQLEQHMQEHEDLLWSARDLQKKIFEADNSVVEEDLDFLEHWLTDHILTFDSRLGTFLANVM